MIGFDTSAPLDVDTVAHVIQTALTPVFLLSGVASLLNVFASRLARVSDRTHAVSAVLESATGAKRLRCEAEIRYLHWRTRLLDGAVLLGTAGGGATCAAGLFLFVGSLRDAIVAGLLYVAFGCALIFTAAALVLFMAEVFWASRGLRERQEAAVRRSEARRRAADGRSAVDEPVSREAPDVDADPGDPGPAATG